MDACFGHSKVNHIKMGKGPFDKLAAPLLEASGFSPFDPMQQFGSCDSGDDCGFMAQGGQHPAEIEPAFFCGDQNGSV